MINRFQSFVFCSKVIALLFLFSSPFPIFATGQELRVCYFDDAQMQMRLPKTPNFLKGKKADLVDRGFMLFYEKKLFDLIGFASIQLGGNAGRWTKESNNLYTGSVFASARVWGFSLLFLRPYLEYSIFGPTITSKTQFGEAKFGSHFLFQNFLAAGVEVGGASGFSLEAKALRYFLLDLTHPKEGFEVPILLSLGYHF